MPGKLPHRSDALQLSDAAMAQLYRGELGRADRWRMRLDTTSNWALTTSVAVISFAFGSRDTPHLTLVVGLWLVVTFMLIEARRYRYYDLWNRRVRLLEEGYWAPLLRREPVDPDALRELALELERPQLHLSWASAVYTRLHRAYGSLLVVLLLSWFVKILAYPGASTSGADLAERANLGIIPGALVLALMGTAVAALVGLWVLSFFVRPPLGELRTRPRSRRLWEAFYRPYSPTQPRARSKAMRRAEPGASP